MKELFPEVEFLRAIDTLVEIFEKTEDKAMYEARQKAIRDHNSLIRSNEARGEAQGEAQGEARGQARGEVLGEARGELYGKIKMLEQLLEMPISQGVELKAMSMEALNGKLAEFQARLRSRT